MSPWYALWLPWIVGGIALHWLLPARWRPAGLIAQGAAFLAWQAWPSAILLAGLTALMVGLGGVAGRRPRLVLAGAGAIAFAFLAFRGRGEALGPTPDLLLLGVAFYVLRALHYLIEAWRGGLPDHGAREAFAYMFFAPTLPLGPIHRFDDFARELRRLRWDPAAFAEGLERILHGYAKVVLLAGLLIDGWAWEAVQPLAASAPGAYAYAECLRASLGLYLRFAGYADVAVGFALALGIRVPENFAAPFLARDLGAFWRRWHISLSRWARDYVYLPLAAVTRSHAAAIVATMAVIGLWHGASARYLAWGLYHGAGMVVLAGFERWRPRWACFEGRAWAFASWALTFQFVTLGFVLTTSPDLAAAWARYRLIFGF